MDAAATTNAGSWRAAALLAGLFLAAGLPATEEAPPSSAALPLNPLALTVPLAPQPVPASDGLLHLTWEVQAVNLSRTDLEVQSIEVWAVDGTEPLLLHSGDQVAAHLSPLSDWTVATAAIRSGSAATAWLDLTLDPALPLPPALETRIAVTGEGIAPGDAVTRVRTVIDTRPVRVIRPPLAGDLWGVLEACCDAANHHRRGQRSVDGHFVLPERYAIDFVQFDRDAELYHGSNINEHYYGFGKPVLAVADATVVDVYDELEDVPPGAPLPPPSLPHAGGNHVILDLGDGVWAMYGHLKAGSIRVQPGQQVRAGEALAQLGNNGNTDLAHLHFQLMDSRNFALAQGLPFVFDQYELVGHVDMEADRIAPVPRLARRSGDLPLTLTVVNFPTPRTTPGER